MTCNKQKPPEILRSPPKTHVGFRRYRSVRNIPGDKRAIVSVDTSSEGSIERTPPPYIKKVRITNICTRSYCKMVTVVTHLIIHLLRNVVLCRDK